RNLTEAEQLLWKHLRSRRFGGHKFRRQQPLGPYVVDFVCFGSRLVIEADGGQHLDSEHDRARDAWLAAAGFRVLRFWNHEILTETQAVLARIHRVLELPPLTPPPLPPGERGKREALFEGVRR